MQVDLDALEAAEAKAPPGPWRMSPWHIEEGSPCVRAPEGWNIAITSSDDNAAFIAAIRNAAPSLIAELREAQSKIADLQDEVKTFLVLWAARYSEMQGLGGAFHPQHFDRLKELGVRMDDFRRADPQPAKETL